MATALKTEVGAVDILLVDDNLTDVFFIREALKRCRFSVRLGVVHDGLEALAYIRKEGHFSIVPDPDLVLLDLNLPKKDGWDVLTEMKKDPELNPIPVLILTASKSEADSYRAYRSNADFYMVKPMNMVEFPMLKIALERLFMGHLRWPHR